MSNEYQSTSINPDVFEQFLTLLNTHCKSSETALAMLSTLCYELMRRSGIPFTGQPDAQRRRYIDTITGG